MAAAATDVLPLVAAGVLGVVLVLLLVRRQASAYAGHVGQLAPGKKKPSPLDRAGMGKREMRFFSREEVARHASREDAWIIVRDPETGEMNVYDVTEYVDEHPGGESILNNAGGDATEGFLGPQHPATVHVLVADFKIGTLAPGDS